jgi:hypothetical protein
MSIAAPLAHPANANSTAVIPHREFRRTRHIKRNIRLQQQIRDLISANPSCRYIGGNFAVEHIARGLSFEPHDLAIADVKIGRRIVVLICVPHRIWDNKLPLSRVIELRAKARAAGHAAILVPQAIIEREPRLGNSQLLARTKSIKVDATSRMAVLAHLIENGASCLSELAGLIRHSDPFGAILHLVTTGVIAIDLRWCITPYTIADIAAPDAGTRH